MARLMRVVLVHNAAGPELRCPTSESHLPAATPRLSGRPNKVWESDASTMLDSVYGLELWHFPSFPGHNPSHPLQLEPRGEAAQLCPLLP